MSSTEERSPEISRRTARLAPEDRIVEILSAARIVLAEKGYENFLTADVAAFCGVSEATIYRYFATKRELLVRVAEDWFREILDKEPEITPQHDEFQQLRHVIRYSLSVIRKEPSVSRFILQELRADPEYRSSSIYRMNRQFTSSVTNVVEEAMAKGIFRKDVSLSLVRDMIFGCIEHRTWAYMRGQGDFSVDETAVSIAEIVFQGLAVPADRDRNSIILALDRLEARASSLQEDIRILKSVLKQL